MSPSLRHLTELVEATHGATFSPRFQSAVIGCLDAGESRQRIAEIVHRAVDHAVDFVIAAREGQAPPKPEPRNTRKHKGKPT